MGEICEADAEMVSVKFEDMAGVESASEWRAETRADRRRVEDCCGGNVAGMESWLLEASLTAGFEDIETDSIVSSLQDNVDLDLAGEVFVIVILGGKSVVANETDDEGIGVGVANSAEIESLVGANNSADVVVLEDDDDVESDANEASEFACSTS